MSDPSQEPAQEPTREPAQDPAQEPTQEPAEEPSSLSALVLHAARDVASVETAFDAELLISTLLGSVYTAVLPDRGAAAASFARALEEHLATSDDAVAPTVAAVLAALTGREVPAVPGGPAWISALGRVQLTGAYAYGDRYGDQTSYVTTYAYDDETLGGPEHAVVVLADHNLGLAKDIFVAAPAAGMIATLRDGANTDEAAMSWFTEIEPSTVRAAATAYLACTDAAVELPDGESLPANRALTLARIELLPTADTEANNAQASKPEAATPEAATPKPTRIRQALRVSDRPDRPTRNRNGWRPCVPT